MVYGYLNGNGQMMMMMEHTNDQQIPLIDAVVQTICSCFEFQQDDSVQLRILAALLAAVTSCNVHGKSLRLIVKTCFNIHLVSRNIINQKTANATLTQMLNLVFQKMENNDQLSSSEQTSNVTTATAAENNSYSLDDDQEDESQLAKDEDFQKIKKSIEEDELRKKIKNERKRQQQVEHEKLANDKNHEQTEVERQISEAVQQSIATVISLHSNIDHTISTTTSSQKEPASVSSPAEVQFKNPYQKDAFFLFKALCRLSMKKLNASNISPDSIEMRSRILSLQLIQTILENAGPTFRNSELFIRDIKLYLCLSLLKNCVSTLPSVFKLSLTIFKALIIHFKHHLKTEIGMFFTNAFLRILESQNSTYQQRIMVIKVLATICEDAQTLVDLFVNYDCALESVNVYETLVSDLARAVQETHAETNWVTPAQELSIKKRGMEALLSIMKSLVQWTQKKRDKKQKKSGDSNIDSQQKSEGDDDDSDEKLDEQESLFEKQRHKKLDLNEGIKLFNKKPSAGIKFLINSGNIGSTPAEIAQFLSTNHSLNKKMIGEYIGHHDDHNVQVLHAFVDLHSFSGLDFESAIRSFLNTFRLPGESQMIDRILQKFAEKYYRDNPNSVFSNADAAYVFAYSIIMLNTELHSPALAYRERMSLSGFIINNRGINDEADLPEEYLTMIYNAIKNKEITLLEEENSAKEKNKDVEQSNLSTQRKKQLLFNRESINIYRQSKSLLKSKDSLDNNQQINIGTTFYNATGVKHVRSMFEISWGPILASITTVLEKHDEVEMTKLALNVLELCIHISARFDLDTERNAFVAALAKFTTLIPSDSNGFSQQVRLKQKNIDAIYLLLKIADVEGNYLRSSWSHILHCISRLEQIFGDGGRARVSQNSLIHPSSAPDFSMLPRDGGPSSKSNSIGFDKIFARSSELNDDAIVDFVKYLCAVSYDELHAPEPRQFSLQKIIEVAYYNMKRIKIVWSKLWFHMSDLFTTVGCHQNQYISMSGIDSLKIMAIKFLEQDELANYHFQRDFLKPFMEIMRRSDKVLNRDLVVQCVGYMIMKRARNIKSGWKIILQILGLAAKLSNDELLASPNSPDHERRVTDSSGVVKLGFDHISMIINEHFLLVSEAFEECITCLSAFAKQQLQTNIAAESILFIRTCTDKVVSGDVEGIPVTQQYGEPDGTCFTDSREHLRVWFPILTGLSQLITSDPREQVQQCAMETLFSILSTHGKLFSAKLWELIFSGVLLPIFDEIKHQQEEEEVTRQQTVDNVWIRTTCERALSLFVDLSLQYFDRVEPLFGEVLKLIGSCFKNTTSEICRIGCACLLQLIRNGKDQLSNAHWDVICVRLLIPLLRQTIDNKSTNTVDSIIVLCLQCFLALPDERFGQHLDQVYPLFCDLIVDSESRTVRQVLKELFLLHFPKTK